jgi:signal transduction histidine kinase
MGNTLPAAAIQKGDRQSFFSGMVFVFTSPSETMETNSTITNEQLKACLEERRQLADELQNEVNQTLASVLLWIQNAKMENNIMDDKSLKQAEHNLKEAIDRLRALHYTLSKEVKG